ncbi:MAG: hypothetical protein WCA24_04415 [Thiomonas sp.]
MVRKLDTSDFRAIRMVLEGSDFALVASDREAPSDLVDPAVWHGIMDIADDVAITTTEWQGSRIDLLHGLWGDWIQVSPTGGIVGNAMFDCSDDMAASLFCLMHGFYKQAIGALRAALETMTFACVCELKKDQQRWESWQAGDDFQFARIRQELRILSIFKTQEIRSQASVGQTLFADRNGQYTGGWATDLYARLSSYIHGRGDTTNTNLWDSNGPIYSARGMKVSYNCFLETYALLLLMAKTALRSLTMPSKANLLFDAANAKDFLSPADRPLCVSLGAELFE